MSRRVRSAFGFLVVASFGVAGLSGAALAAPPPGAWDWTGFYAGAQIGTVFGLPSPSAECPDFTALPTTLAGQGIFDSITPLRGYSPSVNPGNATTPHVYTSPELAAIQCSPSSTGNTSAGAFGFHGGFDWQNYKNVVGVVVDQNWLAGNVNTSAYSFDPDSGVNPHYTTGEYTLPAGLFSIGPLTINPSSGTESSEKGTPFQEFTHTQTLDWYGTGRLRAGTTLGPEGRFLIFATGGLAFGQVSTSTSHTAKYTPDEADRVFDTATGMDSNDGEYFPGSEAAKLPSGCSNFVEFHQTANPAANQTGVQCTDGSSSTATRVGYSLGAGVEFLATRDLSLGGEFLYVNLGDGPFGKIDFMTVKATASLRWK